MVPAGNENWKIGKIEKLKLGSGHANLLIFMDYRSKNRCFLLLNRYFQG